MKKFFRTYKVIIGKSGSKDGIEIQPPFNIGFQITKNTNEKPNTHNLKIYGLSKETRDAISKQDNVCLIYAGYKEEQGNILIAAGNIVNAYTNKQNSETIISLDILDGYVAVRDTIVSIGYEGGISAKRIIKDIATQMGVSLTLTDSLEDRTWNHGFSFYGAAHSALHKVCSGAGYEWSFQNNNLQVIQKLGITTRTAVVLNSNSGLIGFPERINTGATEKSEDGKSKDKVSSYGQQREGWRVKALLTPQINPGDPVILKSGDLDGTFRVDNVKHEGEYDEKNWYTTLEVRDYYE